MSMSTWNLHSPCIKCFSNLPQRVCEIQTELPNTSIFVSETCSVEYRVFLFFVFINVVLLL